ncbi:MAG: hypothetical protein ABFE01_24620, partial [Phycisphaerales bacterium]
MGKWWLLSAATVLWMASGYALVRSQTNAGKRGHSTFSRESGPAVQEAEGKVECPLSPERIVSMAPNLT